MKQAKSLSVRLAALSAALVLGLSACGSPASTSSSQPQSQSQSQSQPASQAQGELVSQGMMELKYAKLFTIEMFEGGYRMIRGGTQDLEYLVVPEGAAVPEGLDPAVVVLQQPITKVYTASNAMMSLASKIGALENFKLCATKYESYYLPDIIAQFDAGNLAYSGSYKEPDYELMTSTGIQLHMDTTMVDSSPEVLEKFAELGIPSLVEDSSLEPEILGRVEWVKLLGVLFGKEAEAEEYFDQQEAKFNAAVAGESYGKTVAMGYLSSDGKCYARNGGDYLAQMIEMAGGDYVCADMKPEDTGNSSMTFEEWYNYLADADYLFYYNIGQKVYSIQELIDANPLFADCKAVQNGNVWVTCDGFSQFSAEMADILTDMNAVLASDGPASVETTYLVHLQ